MSEADLAQADQLWRTAESQSPADHTPVYEFLKDLDSKDPNNVHLKWRLARACKDMSEMAKFDNATKKKFAYEGKDVAAAAIGIDPKVWQAQQFMGTLFGVCSNFEIMNKLGSAATMKKHFETACDLCKDCPEPYHCLGQAEFGFADAGMAASMMGLKGTYDAALVNFMKAEEMCPHACYENQGGHYNRNWLMIIKTLKALKKKPEAKEWFEKLMAAELNTPDDRSALEEAKKLKL